MAEKFCELDPYQIVRLREGRKYFGYGPTQIDEKIKSGEIPAPIALSDTGRAKGWTGRQIIDHHRRRLEKQRANALPTPDNGEREANRGGPRRVRRPHE
jgi:predicted DNA-binding transcriptional regulator AlpA